jgi:magnesium chelatase family protein
VEPVRAHEARDPLLVNEDTMTVRARVTAARELQAERYADQPWRVNGQAPGPRLRQRWPLTEEAAARLDDEMFSGRITRRGATRVHRLAWTLADLAGVGRPGIRELLTALSLRLGAPLQLEDLRRAG